MEPMYAKIILYSAIGIQIITFLLLYRFIKRKELSTYFYVLSTVLILCALIALSIDGKIFTVDHPTNYYLIELAIYLSVELVAFLITLLIKKRKR